METYKFHQIHKPTQEWWSYGLKLKWIVSYNLCFLLKDTVEELFEKKLFKNYDYRVIIQAPKTYRVFQKEGASSLLTQWATGTFILMVLEFLNSWNK